MRDTQVFSSDVAKSLVFGKLHGFAAMPSLLIRSVAFVHQAFHRGADPGEVTLSINMESNLNVFEHRQMICTGITKSTSDPSSI